MHRKKLREIRSKHTEYSPRKLIGSFTLPQHKVKTYDDKRRTEIIKENQHLIRRITDIQLKSRHDERIFNNKKLGSISENMVKANARISLENKQMLYRLLNMLPTISKKKQDIEYIRNSERLYKLKHPKKFSYETRYLIILF